MATVEEAYKAALATYGRTAHGDGPAAIRDAMLAVLDDAHSGLTFGACSCVTTWGDGDRCRAYRELHARIQALKEK